MTTPNPIEEIKAIRHQLGADAGYDIHRIFAELRNARASSGRSYVDLPPRRVAANHAMQRSGGGDVSDNSESTSAAR
ncbi:hypothetical protein [Novipirellula artificiosorum]|uniref:Uncharacterized protein n=1 Tax=Novipirellula artificiosorum TaxID=2528016 RepID=A0A5C6DYF4_9BACT|nr:hypothetical protein [Novipirellula artificiosorum]TWU40857.1 hypothetical protein Poly41_16920 [Novipirellula artificiosorum]